jgi:hypothetical protein
LDDSITDLHVSAPLHSFHVVAADFWPTDLVNLVLRHAIWKTNSSGFPNKLRSLSINDCTIPEQYYTSLLTHFEIDSVPYFSQYDDEKTTDPMLSDDEDTASESSYTTEEDQ